MLLRHGRVAAGGWWAPYGPEHPHILNSLSKSFTSTAIGLAVDEGLLTPNDKVIDYFPEEAGRAEGPYWESLLIRHLLTMSTGHEADTLAALWGNEGNWAEAFFQCPLVHPPGSHFLYNGGATYMLAAILCRAANESLLSYLQPRLLSPLGIEGVVWDTSPQGVETGGWGMRAKTADIAKFGQLYLQKGIWNGRRLLSEAWVNEATTLRIASGTDPESDWSQGYGYQFWRCRIDGYRADGAFGQFCIVLERLDAVVALTAAVDDIQSLLRLVWEHLLPGIGETNLQPDDETYARLQSRLSSLEISVAQADAAESAMGTIGAKNACRPLSTAYKLARNDIRLNKVAFDFGERKSTIVFTGDSGEQRIECGRDEWLAGSFDLNGTTEQVAAKGVWVADNRFVATLCWIHTPFVDRWTIAFTDERVVIQPVRNLEISFLSDSMLFPELTGTAL